MKMMWNRECTAALVNGGGSVMFKGIVRGDCHVPYTFLAPSREAMNEFLSELELDQWVYYVRYLSGPELCATFAKITKGEWDKEASLDVA